MKFWATSESMKGVSEDFFSNLEKEGAINALIRAINARLPLIVIDGWKQWAVIFIIMPDYLKAAFRETRRLTRKDMTLDFRVHVDYEASLQADFAECIDLLVLALGKTLPYFTKAGIGAQTQGKIRECVRLAAEDAKASFSAKGKPE
jgi:hypothetical protein